MSTLAFVPAAMADGVRAPVLRVLRLALPLAAALIVGTLVIWPYVAPSVDRLRLVASLPQADLGADRDAILGVSLAGIDRSGRPYGLAADVVRPLDAAMERLALTAPTLSTTTRDGRALTVVARDGTYDQRHQVVALAGAVRLELNRQYRLQTEEARLDLDTTTAQGASAVEAFGPFGRLAAEGFRIEDGGNTMLFTGRARLSLEHGMATPSP